MTFIEIEIDIITGSHQLKMRFLFAIVYKNGLFQILGFSSYQKKKKQKKKKNKQANLECRMLIRNFAEDVPLIVLHTTSGLLQKCYFQSSCGYAFMKMVFRHSWKYRFNSIYNTAKINYPLYLWINSFFINAEQSRCYKTHGIRTTRLQVSRA